VKRILLFGLLAGMLTTGSGCGLYQAVFCPSGGCGRCGPSYCGDECGDECGPACGPRRPLRPACAPRRAVVADCGDDCGECARPCGRANCRSCSPCGDPCGDPCGGRCWHRGPLSCLFALLMPNCWCGPSCGERYWGDFYSDAPDCSDPCDCNGNYAGHSGGGGGGCHSCGGGHARSYHGGYADEGAPMDEGYEEVSPRGERSTGPAPQPTPAPRKAPLKRPSDGA
jgi:hypothetical protein